MSEDTIGLKVVKFLKEKHFSKLESVDDVAHTIIYYNMGQKSELLESDLDKKIDAIIDRFDQAYFSRNIKSTIGLDIPTL